MPIGTSLTSKTKKNCLQYKVTGLKGNSDIKENETSVDGSFKDVSITECNSVHLLGFMHIVCAKYRSFSFIDACFLPFYTTMPLNPVSFHHSNSCAIFVIGVVND